MKLDFSEEDLLLGLNLPIDEDVMLYEDVHNNVVLFMIPDSGEIIDLYEIH